MYRLHGRSNIKLIIHEDKINYINVHTQIVLTRAHTHTHSLAVGLVVRYLPDVYVDKLVSFLAERIDHAPHLQFYIRWCRELLCVHGDRLKERSSEIVASLRDLQKSVLQKQADIGLLYVTKYDIIVRHAQALMWPRPYWAS